MNRKWGILTGFGVALLAFFVAAPILANNASKGNVPESSNLAVFGPERSIQLNGTGYASAVSNGVELGFSKARREQNRLASLDYLGLIFNKEALLGLEEIEIYFEKEAYQTATLYSGDSFLPTGNWVVLGVENRIKFDRPTTFFCIQNRGKPLVINSLTLHFAGRIEKHEVALPTVSVMTEIKNGAPSGINSLTEYTTAEVSLSDPTGEFDLASSPAGIRLRGHSTSLAPKKPYRIKFDKKQSLFGLPKAKNWVLLADYMDGSYIHNFTAFTFAHMVRGEDEFTVHPKHVNLNLNGQDMGVYLLCENPDEKAGRLDLEVDDGFFLKNIPAEGPVDLSILPFSVERSRYIDSYRGEMLGMNCFAIPEESGESRIYHLEYPEVEDFQTDPEDPQSVDWGRYSKFFNAVVDYIGEVNVRYKAISRGVAGAFQWLSEIVDVSSAVSYGLVDLFTAEVDHARNSAKFYHRPNEKLRFGTVWDYDAVSYCLPYEAKPVEDPFAKTADVDLNLLTCGDPFTRALFANKPYGRSMFRDLWGRSAGAASSKFQKDILNETNLVLPNAMHDVEYWHEGDYATVYENVRWMQWYIPRRLVALNRLLVES